MGDLLRTYGPVLLVVIVFYVLFRYVAPLFLPFLFAVAIAVLIDPWVNAIERRTRLPRGIVVATVLALVVVLFFLFSSVGVAKVATEIQLLAQDVPFYYEQFERRLTEFSVVYGDWIASLPPPLQEQIRHRQEEWVGRASETLDSLGRYLQDLVLEGLPNLFVVLLVTIIATFFFSRDRNAVKRFGLALLPKPWREAVDRLFRRLFESFVGLTNAVVLLVVLTAAATTIGLTLLGSKFALLLGVTSGLLDIVPIIGPSLLFVPWIAYHLLFGDVVFGLLLLLLYGVVTGVRTVLQAQIIGGQVGLHPLTTLVSLYVGAKLFGPIGFVVGPLVVVVIKAMHETGVLSFNRG